VTWVKIDDQMPDHPKIRGLGKLAPLASTLQFRALCYASRYLTDGRIPGGAVAGLLDGFDAWGIETGGIPGLMAIGMDGDEIDWPGIMVDAGLWERTRSGDYLIHDYLDYNPTRESVLRDREVNKRRQKKFRDRNVDRNAVTNGPVTGAPSPSPLASTADAVDAAAAAATTVGLSPEGTTTLTRLLRAAQSPDGLLAEVRMIVAGERALNPKPSREDVSLALQDLALTGERVTGARLRSFCEAAARKRLQPKAATSGTPFADAMLREAL
jgi:hypothetical protein